MRTMFGLTSILIAASACSSPDPELQQRLGGAVYSTYCQSCHETPGTGPRLTPAVLASRLDAARLYTYNQQQMPYNAAETLSDEDYLNVTAWLLVRANLLAPNTTLSMRNMETVLLTPSTEGIFPSTPKP